VTDLSQRIDACMEQMERDRKDALRYRWLRDSRHISRSGLHMDGTSNIHISAPLGRHIDLNDAIDSAIAARNLQEKTK